MSKLLSAEKLAEIKDCDSEECGCYIQELLDHIQALQDEINRNELDREAWGKRRVEEISKSDCEIKELSWKLWNAVRDVKIDPLTSYRDLQKQRDAIQSQLDDVCRENEKIRGEFQQAVIVQSDMERRHAIEARTELAEMTSERDLLRERVKKMRDAFNIVWAVVGDRLLGNQPLSASYVVEVMEQIKGALYDDDLLQKNGERSC